MYIELINREWRKVVPPFINASHCEFYGARCVTTHDEPPFPRLIRLLTRELVPSLFEESITQSS